MNNSDSEKKEYHSPDLLEWGSIQDLTQGPPGYNSDTVGGSVT